MKRRLAWLSNYTILDPPCSFFLHPYKGWRFLVAPGIDIHDEDGDNNFLFRAGAAYELEIAESWSITPEFNVDFVDGDEVLVYGLSFGYEF